MPTKLKYVELSEELVTGHVCCDLNRLLPQLCSNPEQITATWLRHLFNSGTRIFAALDEGRIVGVVLLCQMVILTGQKDWIEDVVVDAAYRRRGVASTLMDVAELASRAGKAKGCNLTSNPNRREARRMYGRRGYTLRDTGVFRLVF